MAIRKHAETRRCTACGNRRVRWTEVEGVRVSGANPNECPRCGLPLMEMVSGSSVPIDPRQMVIWDEQEVVRIKCRQEILVMGPDTPLGTMSIVNERSE